MPFLSSRQPQSSAAPTPMQARAPRVPPSPSFVPCACTQRPLALVPPPPLQAQSQHLQPCPHACPRRGRFTAAARHVPTHLPACQHHASLPPQATPEATACRGAHAPRAQLRTAQPRAAVHPKPPPCSRGRPHLHTQTRPLRSPSDKRTRARAHMHTQEQQQARRRCRGMPRAAATRRRDTPPLQAGARAPESLTIQGAPAGCRAMIERTRTRARVPPLSPCPNPACGLKTHRNSVCALAAC